MLMLSKRQLILGEPNGHPQECPPDPARSRASGQYGWQWANAGGRRYTRRRWLNWVGRGHTRGPAAIAGGFCPRTVRKWVGRHKQEGPAGLQDRSSRPHRLRKPTPQPVIDRIQGAVVGHDPLDFDAEACVVGDGGPEEGLGTTFALVFHDAAEGDA